MKDAAYAVDGIKNGVAADRVLADGEHQAVLLDLGLPLRDGLEVLRRLRQTGKTLPVIIITARDGAEERIPGLDLGADDYLVRWKRCASAAADRGCSEFAYGIKQWRTDFSTAVAALNTCFAGVWHDHGRWC